MGKLNYKTSEFDAAIRKVRSDYADVSSVNASSLDVVKDKTIMNAQKELIEGSLEDADISLDVLVKSTVVGETESNYPISATPSINASKSGYISEIEEGTAITKYVRVETKTCTPSTSRQEIKASYGKLMEEVDVGAAEVPAVIQGIYVSSYKFSKPTGKSSSTYGAYVPSGSKHNNVFCSAEDAASGKAKIYLFRVGESINDLNYFTIVDPETKQIPDTTIILSAGESVTATSNTYAPSGTLTFTSEGRLQFTHSSSFYCMDGSGSCIFLLYIDGYYYVPCVDYKLFHHNYNGVGSYAKTTAGYEGGSLSVVKGDTPINYYKPKILFANLTNVYFYFYWNKTTNYEALRMTFNYGTFEGFFIEGEE